MASMFSEEFDLQSLAHRITLLTQAFLSQHLTKKNSRVRKAKDD